MAYWVLNEILDLLLKKIKFITSLMVGVQNFYILRIQILINTNLVVIIFIKIALFY